jgi:hypothetical protein
VKLWLFEIRTRRVGKGALRAVPTMSPQTQMVGTLRSAHPTRVAFDPLNRSALTKSRRTEITAIAMPMRQGERAANLSTLKSNASRLATRQSAFGIVACPASESRKASNRTSNVPGATTIIGVVRLLKKAQKPQRLIDRGRAPRRVSTICSPPLIAELP